MADAVPVGQFYVTPALETDFSVIKALIHETGINPMSLDWRRFRVAKTVKGDEFIGCGQLKPHGDGTVELASIAVVMDWRRKGVASAVIEKLMAEGPRPLYLTCLSHNGPFYEKFGFRIITGAELPKYFWRLSKMAALFSALGMMRGKKMLVMRLN